MPKLIQLPDFGLLKHFWETWDALGGFKGIGVIVVIVIAFNFVVHWYITSAGESRKRKKIEAAKKRAGKKD